MRLPRIVLALVAMSLIVASLLVANCPGRAHAQLFGQRNLGGGLNSPSAPAPPGDSNGPLVGQSGRAAFQRVRPSANDFVGRDQLERQTFIGRAQGTVSESGSDSNAQLRGSRAQEILRRRRPNANVLQIQRGAGDRGPIYSPRLAVAFEHRPSASAKSDRQVEGTIASIFATHDFQGITISIKGGAATLRGTVASKDQKMLAEAAVNLEPAVRSVDNQLQFIGERPRKAEEIERPR